MQGVDIELQIIDYKYCFLDRIFNFGIPKVIRVFAVTQFKGTLQNLQMFFKGVE